MRIVRRVAKVSGVRVVGRGKSILNVGNGTWGEVFIPILV